MLVYSFVIPATLDVPVLYVVSVNTALDGTDFPKVYVHATGIPFSSKYTGLVAEPADLFNFAALFATPPAEDDPA